MFNLDESGQQDFIDARKVHIVIPDALNQGKITYPVDRTGKRITLLHCISTDGTALTPMLIVPRKYIDDEVFDIISDETVMLRSQSNGFLTSELFKEWMLKIFIPAIENKRKKRNYNGMALLLMDGFKGHQKAIEEIQSTLNEKKILIMWFPPHSSDQVQPLDLLGFNLQKFASSRVHRNKHYSAQTNAIIRIIDGLQEVTTASKIMGAWHRAGIYKQRPCKAESVDDVIQFHCIDIDANGNIRNKATDEKENAAITTYTDTSISYVKAEPNELYPKTKRIPIPGMTVKVTNESNSGKTKIGSEKQISEEDISEIPEILPKKQRSEEANSVRKRLKLIEKEFIVEPPETMVCEYRTVTINGKEKNVKLYF